MNMNWGGEFAIFWIIWMLLIALVNISFALGVFMDADLMKRQAARNTFLVSHWIWAFATLIGGVFVAGIYWAVHHSTLNPFNNIKENQ